MNKSKLTVSVIVIGFNVESQIEKTLDSVQRQTFSNLEILYVDDGSNDNSIKVVESIQAKDPRIRIIAKQNGGANSARVKGVEKSHGDYIMFVDGDDLLPSNAISTLSAAWVDQVDFVAGNFEFVNGDAARPNTKFVTGTFSSTEYVELLLRDKIPPFLVTKLYKKNFLIDAGFSNIPRLTMAEDLAASVKIGLSGSRCVYIDQVVYNYNINDNSMSHSVSEKFLEIPIAMSYIESWLKKRRIENAGELMNYRWFLIFLWYVVKSSNPFGDVQKQLNHQCKGRNIYFKDSLVREEISRQPLVVKVLIVLYRANYWLGALVAWPGTKLKEVFAGV